MKIVTNKPQLWERKMPFTFEINLHTIGTLYRNNKQEKARIKIFFETKL